MLSFTTAAPMLSSKAILLSSSSATAPVSTSARPAALTSLATATLAF